MFDCILQSHFRALPGVKKVAKREYSIEDSLTGTVFRRDRPWLSQCKPGLKVGMSMIFSRITETIVSCPKCKTVSRGLKDAVTEWYLLGTARAPELLLLIPR